MKKLHKAMLKSMWQDIKAFILFAAALVAVCALFIGLIIVFERHGADPLEALAVTGMILVIPTFAVAGVMDWYENTKKKVMAEDRSLS